VTNSFPTPNISEILNSLGKSRYFSTLDDVANAYHVIEVEENSRPITAELNNVKNTRSIVWTPEMISNFNTLKQMFTAALCRATPNFSPTTKPFILTIDFSKTAIGAVLSQEQDNVERFLGIKGRKWRNYESNYHSSKGELLALLYGITKFEHLL